MIGGENCLSISFITEKTNLDENCISQTISSQIRSVFSLWIGKKGLAKTKYAGHRRSEALKDTSSRPNDPVTGELQSGFNF